VKPTNDPIDSYMELLEALKPEQIDRLIGLCSDDVRFKDPFHDVTGKAAYTHVLQDMCKKLEWFRFDVSHRALDGNTWLFAWVFSAKAKVVGDFSFDGMSLVQLNDADQVTLHIDYWDGAEGLLQRLPVLGSGIKALRGAFGAKHD
jgi:steroid delta-isomerase